MSDAGPRYAVYCAPPAGSPLDRLGQRWLGRDVRSGMRLPPFDDVPGLAPGELERITEAPRRYGLHATLRAPFRLREGGDAAQLDAAIRSIAARHAPFELPLAPAVLRGFLAWQPLDPPAALTRLERDCVESLAALCAAPNAHDLARRRPERLSPRQRALLDAWGYPYVLDEYRFHLTLTGQIDPALAGRLAEWLAARMAAEGGGMLRVAALALFVEPSPGAPFLHWRDYGFDGGVVRYRELGLAGDSAA